MNKDCFGLSWPVAPTILVEMTSDPEAAKAKRVMAAALDRTKFDIAPLMRAGVDDG